MAQNDDEGSYSCSAVWDDDTEPSNEIDVRVMGQYIICWLKFCSLQHYCSLFVFIHCCFGFNNYSHENSLNFVVTGLTFNATGAVYAERSDHTFFCAATVPSDSAVIISWTRNGQPVREMDWIINSKVRKLEISVTRHDLEQDSLSPQQDSFGFHLC